MARCISKKGLAFIEDREGKEHEVYLDSARLPTIGIGHLLKKDELHSGKVIIGGHPVKYRNGLTDDEIYELLDQDLDGFEEVVNDVLDRKPTQHEFDALVSLTMNIGAGAFAGSTLLKRINAGAERAEIERQWKRWKYAGGRIINGLIIRRKYEVALYFDGVYE